MRQAVLPYVKSRMERRDAEVNSQFQALDARLAAEEDRVTNLARILANIAGQIAHPASVVSRPATPSS